MKLDTKRLIPLILASLGFLVPARAQEVQEDSGAVFEKAKEVAGVKISGLLRNDAYYINNTDSPIAGPAAASRDGLFSDILETRLVLERTQDDWSFYADGRLYVYTGEIQNAYGPSRALLMRAYARYFSPIGDFTLGKTYVNFGTQGLFNPFEIDKTMQFTDLQYARQGLYAFEYILPWQDLSGLKVYAGFNDSFNYEVMWGISPGLHLGKFDTGAVFNHSAADNNIAGVYFKGDAFVGVQASWGASFDDAFSYQRSQVSAGIDYSFFDGQLITSFIFYYNEDGAEDPVDYMPSTDSFLMARYYGFFSAVWTIDEFWNVSASLFMNFVDNSLLIIPSVSFVIANGLTLNLQGIVPTTETEGEFARDTLGNFSLLMRVEGKF